MDESQINNKKLDEATFSKTSKKDDINTEMLESNIMAGSETSAISMEEVEISGRERISIENYVLDKVSSPELMKESLLDHSSKNTESISEEIILNDSNNVTIADDVNTFSNHISIPSLNLKSTSQSASHPTLSPSKTSANSKTEESSKLDIVYVEEGDTAEKKCPEHHLKISFHSNSQRSLNSNSVDSLEKSVGSKAHQNSKISPANSAVLSDTEDSLVKEINSSNENIMTDSIGDPPLQLNLDPNEKPENDRNEDSTLSDDVIKLDIRGQASASNPFLISDIKLLPSTTIYYMSSKPIMAKSKSVSVQQVYDMQEDDYSEQDCAIEEVILDHSKRIPKGESPGNHDPEVSLSTVTTDYKTLCEDFNSKIPDIQHLLEQKDSDIEELKLSLNESAKAKNDLQIKYDELVLQISNYQKLLSETAAPSDFSKEQQLSDFIKHEQFIHEDDDKEITESNLYNTNDRESLLALVTKEVINRLDSFLDGVNGSLGNKSESQPITLAEVLSSIKPDNPDLVNLLGNIEKKHKCELENLRTYFEDRCMKIKNAYSEEVSSHHSKKVSPDSSLDSLDNSPEALPFGSPLHGGGDKTTYLAPHAMTRSRSAEFNVHNNQISVLQYKIKNIEDEHRLHIKNINLKNEKLLDELKTSYNAKAANVEDMYASQIMDLKAHIETLQSAECDSRIMLEQRNADKDLEEVLTHSSKYDISTWPTEFISFKEKCEFEMQQVIDRLKKAHAHELSAMENENKKQLDILAEKTKVEVDKWKQKRNDAFDKNRNLEETIKERDGLRHVTHTLQKVLSYMIEHFNMCEDELNNTFVGELFKFLDDDDLDNTFILGSFTSSKNNDKMHSTSLNVLGDNLEISTVSTKRVHIAPKFSEIMPFIQSDSILDCLDKTEDIRINFKQELDTCLKRLHDEAQELLSLSQVPKRKSILGPPDGLQPTKDHANVEELLQEYQDLKIKLDKSEKTIKDLEDVLEQCAFREASLKAELQTTYERLSSPHTGQHRESSECYSPTSLPSPPTRLVAELQAANTEKEDMQMQLEAANKQLRSTKQFLEEQAVEREHERDEFQNELKHLKEENTKLIQKNQQYIHITKEVDQLEVVMRDLTNKISDLESENQTKQAELISSIEEIQVLRDLIASLESQLEVKSAQEVEVMRDLENFRLLAEEKGIKLEDVKKELSILKNDVATKIADDLLSKNEKNVNGRDTELEAEKKMIEQMRGELQTLLKILSEHTAGLESLHEAICSQSCSSPSEDVSVRDHKKGQKRDDPPLDVSNGRLPVLEVWQLGDGLQRHLRAEDAAVKRIRDLEMQLRQLKDVSQELRMERDVLQDRMSEQSLKISSLQSRLDQTRHTVEAQSYHSMEGLRRQLDEALAEVQLLKESLDSKDKQLKAYEGTPSPESGRDLIQKLKREVDEYKTKLRDLQKVFDEKHEEYETMIADKNADIDVLRKQLLEKERHLQAVISLQVEEDKDKDLINDGKLSARTLSDILSISEFDEPDMILRRNEPVAASFVSEQFPLHMNETKENEVAFSGVQNVMQPPHAVSEYDFNNLHHDTSPEMLKEGSLPQLKDESRDHHQVTTDKGGQSLSKNVLSENVSMFPNKDASGDKNVSIQPRKLDFSVAELLEEMDRQPNKNPFSFHNLSLNEPLYTSGHSNKIVPPYKSLDDLGIVADYQQKIYPDILTQLKSEIQFLNEQLIAKTSALLMAQEQISEFPTVKNEMEELERMLQNSLETMQEDKKYYNNQLENFALGEKILKEKLEQARKEITEKCDEIRILKEDILRRETMVTEICKEKKFVEAQLSKLEDKCQILESNSSESKFLKGKLAEFEKLEQLISEKNLQIDNLNENLDKLDDLQKQVLQQKTLNDNLNSNLIKKMKEIADIQQENQQLKHQGDQLSMENKKLVNDLKRTSNKNNDLNTTLKVYRDMFALLEKDLEGILQKQVASPRLVVGGPLITPNDEEFVKFEEYKQLLSGLEGQSPNNSHSESLLESQRRDLLNKIRLKINTLQSELHSKRKELSLKALQIEKAKLEIEDLKMQVEYYNKGENEKNNMLQELIAERDELRSNLQTLNDRLREESNLQEILEKFEKKTEECRELERQISNLKSTLDRYKSDNVERATEIEGFKMTLSEREDHITHLLTTMHNLQQEKNRLEQDSNSKLNLIQEKAISDQLSKQVALLKSQLEELQNKSPNGDKVSDSAGWIQQDKFDKMNAKFEKQVEITQSLVNEIQSLNGQLESEKIKIVNLQSALDSEKQQFQREIMIQHDQNSLIIDLQKKNHELHLELVHVREMLHLQKNKNVDFEKKLAKLQESQKQEQSAETYETLLETENLLRRNIMENIQMSETVRVLTQERRDLQSRVKHLENLVKMSARRSTSLFNLPEGVDQQVSYLYGRYMRVESYRKALIWQKGFLTRVASAGFIIQNWKTSESPPLHKFKCVAFAIIAVSRMKYLVKRWHTGNRIGVNLHLNKPNVYPTELRNSKSYSHIPSCSYKSEVKSRHALLNTLGLYAGGTKLGNNTWTGSSNPNISVLHGEKLNDWDQSHYNVEMVPEQGFSRRSRVSGVVIEESDRVDDHNEQLDNKTTSNKVLQEKSLLSGVPSTSNRYNNTITREPLDAKLHRALFSPREQDI